MKCDYLIVGTGLTGAVIARLLADAGREVIVVDRRSHLGGNVHDSSHPSGVCIHTYGPHYFRTSSDTVWNFATRFSEFYRFEACVVSDVDGSLIPWPLSRSYIDKIAGKNWQPEFQGTPQNFEEAALKLMPRIIYTKFVKEYNEKQWGIDARMLSAELCKRFDVRDHDEPRLKPNARYQGIPTCGYTEWMSRILKGIPVILNFDFLLRASEITAKKLLVYSGPIDHFFGCELGELQYRGQRREHVFVPGITKFAQPCGQINNPLHQGGKHIRTLEWKHMMNPQVAANITGTVLTKEFPFTPTQPDDFEYPFPDERNSLLYQQYRRRADSLEKTLICGRLGEYRYYDMDQAIARAFVLANRELKLNP